LPPSPAIKKEDVNMHARLLTMNVGPGMRSFATGLADEGFKMAKAQPGFVNATYLVIDEAAGEYGSLTVWNTNADAMAAAEKLRPWLEQKLAGKAKSPPVVRVAEVYTPK
jgi:hypothetical protein